MENKRYLNCKYLDAGMDGMLCSKKLCTTCKEFNGEKGSNFISKNRYVEANKRILEVDTIEKAELITNLPDGGQKRTEVQIPKFNPDLWKKDTKQEKQIEEMILDMFDYARTLVNIKTAKEDSVFINTYKETLKGYAKYLINKNYCKIPEDAVVVPKDEYCYLKDMADRYDPFWFCAFGGCEGVCKECIDTCEMSIFVKERKATVEKCIQLLENMKVNEDGRHEWRDHHNDCIDKCKAKLAKEFEIEIKEKQ